MLVKTKTFSGYILSKASTAVSKHRNLSVLFSTILLLFFSGCSPEKNIKKVQSLIYLTEDVPAGLDNDGPAAAIPTSQIGIVNLVDPLIDYALDDSTGQSIKNLNFEKFEGRLAESWSFNKDTLTWTFKLRKNVISCAGNNLSADDILYTFARAKSVSGAAPIGWFLSSVASIDTFTTEVLSDPTKRSLGSEIRKVDDYTVTIRQSVPNQLFLPALTTFGIRIYDSKEAIKHSTESDPWSHNYINNTSLPGYGPYCLERWSKGNEFIITANPNYYRGAPQIKRIVFKKIPQSSNRFIIMRMKQGDITTGLTPREFFKLEEFEHINVLGITGNENIFVHMNFDTPPFDNLLVRKAIAAAIPYEWIIKNVYFNQATQWKGLIPSRYPGGKSYFEVENTGTLAAKKLLELAGYKDGEGLQKYKSSFKLSYVSEKEATLGPVATAVRTALRDAGFPVELDPIPLTQYGDRQLVKRDLPFALNDQEKPIVVDAGYAVQLFFASPEAGGVNNMTNNRNERVDQLWEEARSTAAPERRTTLITEIYKQLSNDIAWLPIAEYQTQWASKIDIEGFTWYPDNAIRFSDLRVKK